MKKIMFNDRYGLTAAVLQGRKTMTRRIVPTQYVPMIEDGLQGAALIEAQRHGDAYRESEIVAVAQSYEDIYHHGGPEYGSYELVNNYRRLHIRPWKDITQQAGWLNKMFVRPDLMPHQSQITDINIERLQDITDEDCLKEGVICETFDDGTPLCYKVLGIYDKPKSLLLKEFMTPREAFAALINRPGVGRKGLWEENPFVFAYSLKLIK